MCLICSSWFSNHVRKGREATAKTAEGPMPHHRQTHSFTIYRGEAIEGGIHILLDKHRVSLKQQESLVSLCSFILQPTDHRELKQGTTLWGCPNFLCVDLAAKNVVKGNQMINCQIQLTVYKLYIKCVPVYNKRKKVWNIANVRCQTLKAHHRLRIVSWFENVSDRW